jgi:hypothetical protein
MRVSLSLVGELPNKIMFLLSFSVSGAAGDVFFPAYGRVLQLLQMIVKAILRQINTYFANILHKWFGLI